MKKAVLSAVMLGLAGLSLTGGCARPFEFGYTPAYTANERAKLIARNWDNEGKQISDDIDTILLLRPQGRLTIWNVR
jgi:hypothetical protein